MNRILPDRGRTRQQPAADIADAMTIAVVWLLLIAGLIREILGQSEIASIGNYTLHSIDAAVVVAVIAVLLHLAKFRLDWRPYSVPILAMAALILFNFLRGMATEPAAALLWIRANGADAAVLILAIVMRPSWPVMRAARRALIVCALALVALEAMRLATHPTLFMTSGISDADANDGGRPLTSFGAFLMVAASGLLTSEIASRRRQAWDYSTAIALILPLAIMLTRQGTAVVAELVVLAAVIFLQRGSWHGRRVVWAGSAATVSLGFLALIYPLLIGSEDFARRTGNLEMRQRIWESLMHGWPQLPWTIQALGYPAGQAPPVVIYASGSYRLWAHSIHSMYYGSLPMMGYAGLIAFCALLALLIAESLKRGLRRSDALPAFPLALCLGSAVLSYSYELRGDALIGLFLAIAALRLAAAADRSTAETPATASAETTMQGAGQLTHPAPPIRLR